MYTTKAKILLHKKGYNRGAGGKRTIRLYNETTQKSLLRKQCEIPAKIHNIANMSLLYACRI